MKSKESKETTALIGAAALVTRFYYIGDEGRTEVGTSQLGIKNIKDLEKYLKYEDQDYVNRTKENYIHTAYMDGMKSIEHLRMDQGEVERETNLVISFGDNLEQGYRVHFETKSNKQMKRSDKKVKVSIRKVLRLLETVDMGEDARKRPVYQMVDNDVNYDVRLTTENGTVELSDTQLDELTGIVKSGSTLKELYIKIKSSKMKFGYEIKLNDSGVEFRTSKGNKKEEINISDILKQGIEVTNGVITEGKGEMVKGDWRAGNVTREGKKEVLKDTLEKSYDFGKIVGYYVAVGGIHKDVNQSGNGYKKFIRYRIGGGSKADRKIYRDVEKYFKGLGRDVEMEVNGDVTHSVYVRSNLLGQFMERLVGNVDKDKHLSAELVDSNELFLKGLVEGMYGGLMDDAPEWVSVRIKNFQLLIQVQEILNGLNITTWYNEVDKGYMGIEYTLHVSEGTKESKEFIKSVRENYR